MDGSWFGSTYKLQIRLKADSEVNHRNCVFPISGTVPFQVFAWGATGPTSTQLSQITPGQTIALRLRGDLLLGRLGDNTIKLGLISLNHNPKVPYEGQATLAAVLHAFDEAFNFSCPVTIVAPGTGPVQAPGRLISIPISAKTVAGGRCDAAVKAALVQLCSGANGAIGNIKVFNGFALTTCSVPDFE